MSLLEHSRFGRPRSERNYASGTYRRASFSLVRRRGRSASKTNVGRNERIMSLAAGGVLAALGLSRKSLAGLVMAGVGGGLLYRGASGYCSVYDALGVDTCPDHGADRLTHGPHPARHGTHVVESLLINKSAQELYDYWRNFENLPHIMSHLESVEVLDERRSRWTAAAPWIAGGSVSWEAEIIRDEPGKQIAWRSLPDSQIDQRGMVTFLPAAGERGVIVRVDFEYRPPAGQIGRIFAKLLGEDPAQTIHEDLRSFKQVMEIGESITVEGQPQGRCVGRGLRRR